MSEAGDHGDHAGHERDHAADRRDRAGAARDDAGNARDTAGAARDDAGEARDSAAAERDRAADQRDRAADHRDRAAVSSAAHPEFALPDAHELLALGRRDAAADRQVSSADRRAGAGDRTDARLDRGAALADRNAGALRRERGIADRDASAREREDASVDDLTGVSVRGAGFLALDREIARVKRLKGVLVVAFVDVDGLKATNDEHGHAAGDRMLLDVADALRANMRAYDLIFRYGGDEFVCAFTADACDVARRMVDVSAVIAQKPSRGSISVGLAELRAPDSTSDLIARADAALYEARQARGVSFA